ncbi:hypothetical protein ACF07D_11155 [Leucobacter sp. NPDC015123]|uniref:hypothetical protein n=1 Tax=Leucobacter sp. NPDC015123 TaxID=3364129 RepID=UPI0036F4A08A
MDQTHRLLEPQVPVDRRIAGFDKRSIPIASVVLALFLVMTFALPAIDRSIEWDDPIVAGDQLALSAEVIVTPAPGWNLESGYRVTDDTREPNGPATLASAGITIEFVADAFSGTPAELLAQSASVAQGAEDHTFHARGTVDTVSTSAGVAGVRQSFVSSSGDGQLVALVLGDTGVTITVRGASQQLHQSSSAIDQMISSVRAMPAGGRQ